MKPFNGALVLLGGVALVGLSLAVPSQCGGGEDIAPSAASIAEKYEENMSTVFATPLSEIELDDIDQEEYDFLISLSKDTAFLAGPGAVTAEEIKTLKLCRRVGEMTYDDDFNCRDFSKWMLRCLHDRGFTEAHGFDMYCKNCEDGTHKGHRIVVYKYDSTDIWCPREPQDEKRGFERGCCSKSRRAAEECAHARYCEGLLPNRKTPRPSFAGCEKDFTRRPDNLTCETELCRPEQLERVCKLVDLEPLACVDGEIPEGGECASKCKSLVGCETCCKLKWGEDGGQVLSFCKRKCRKADLPGESVDCSTGDSFSGCYEGACDTIASCKQCCERILRPEYPGSVSRCHSDCEKHIDEPESQSDEDGDDGPLCDGETCSDELFCSNGLPGVEHEGICCNLSCGTCGGTGCFERPGGRDNCCVSSIEDSGRLCSNVGAAPCIID